MLSIDELFMHYFHNLSSASESFASRPPPGLHPWIPLGDFRPQTPNLLIPGKNPADAHGEVFTFRERWSEVLSVKYSDVVRVTALKALLSSAQS